jgi:hypothetical protein
MQKHAYTRAFGSQSEIPAILLQEDGSWLVQGYQSFRVGQHRILEAKSEHQKKFMAIAPFIPLLRHHRFIDIGCSAGYFGIQILLHGASHVSFVDHDPEYLDITAKLLRHLELNNSEYTCSTVGTYYKAHDVGIALALVHWIYSYSDKFGSLPNLVAHLAGLAPHTLFIEWIDPDDYAMDLAQHIQQNPERIRGPYTKALFLHALQQHYPTVVKLSEITPTRKIYVATQIDENLVLEAQEVEMLLRR